MPYSLATKDGRMKAVFETSFKGGLGYDRLERLPGRLPEAAHAPAR
jgi:hypothetical protein